MTPAEAVKAATVRFSGKDTYARFGKRERWLSPGSRSKSRAIESAHRGEIARALQAGQPVSASAVDVYKIEMPAGYERVGDRFVSPGAGEKLAAAVGHTVATVRGGRRNSGQPRMAA